METLLNHNSKAVFSVTEVIREVDLSRPRFYQLVEKGIFPWPLYSIKTKRPFYTREQKQKCVEIRRTGIGFNGQPVVFNCLSKKRLSRLSGLPEDRYDEIADTLKQMGLRVTSQKIKKAIMVLYSEENLATIDDGEIIGNLFRYFRQ